MKVKHTKLNISKDKDSTTGTMSASMEIVALKQELEVLRAEKEKAEQEAKNTFSNLEQIIACMPGSVFWKDINGAYQGCNDELAKLFGISKNEVLGKTDDYFSKKLHWGKQVTEAFIEVDKKVMQSGVPRLNFEEPPFQFADGRVIYQLANKVPLRNEEGDVTGIVGIAIDISELKATQALLKKEKELAERLSKEKSEFIANMSHDVKTPLSGIIGLSEILKVSLKGDELSFVEDISVSAEQLMDFFNNCLEMAKSEHLDITLIKEPFNLQRLIQQISELFRSSIEHKKLNFCVHYDPKIPDVLLGSHSAVYRVLLNLTGNAIKFTNKGDVSIHVSLSERTNEKKAIIKLVVQDTGIGIPKEKQSVIFDQFTRLTPSYQGLYEGTGIGLFVVNKLVKSLDGEIYVTSEEGKGSKFLVILPFDRPLLGGSEYEENNLNFLSVESIAIDKNNLSKKTQSRPNPVQTMSTQRKIKVLLVEDNRISQDLGKLLLSALDCEVDIAENGAQTLKQFEPGKYDLIFMDVGLPDTNGDKLAYELRQTEKGSAYHVPIIGLTAHPLENVVAACTLAGMQDVLSKPLSSSKALDLIHRYVDQGETDQVASEPSRVRPDKRETIALGPDLPETTSALFELTKHHLLDTQKAIEVIGNPRVLKEILGKLVQEVIPEEALSLRNSYAEKNWDRIEAIAHKLKGGCFYCGTIKMLYACQYLERYCRAGHKQLLKALYDQCITVLEETRQYVGQWLLSNP